MISEKAIAKLTILSYPDPVLRKKCALIEDFSAPWALVAQKMCSLMHANNGVGLAGPQVGLPWRIFVWNPTGDAENDQVCINPVLSNCQGQIEGEEGCLSIEGVNIFVKRAESVELETRQPDGSTIRMGGEQLTARIWQHENDHLDGRLILDYMSPAEEIATRRTLKELEAKYNPPRSKRSYRKSASR